MDYVEREYRGGRSMTFHYPDGGSLKGNIVDWEIIDEGNWVNVVEKIKDTKGNFWYRYVYWRKENGYWRIRARTALIIPERLQAEFIKAQLRLFERD